LETTLGKGMIFTEAIEVKRRPKEEELLIRGILRPSAESPRKPTENNKPEWDDSPSPMKKSNPNIKKRRVSFSTMYKAFLSKEMSKSRLFPAEM